MHGESGSDVGVHAGFPNPADDTSLSSLNLNQLLIEHPASTFLFEIMGNEWESEGIFAGDTAIVNRALTPRPTDRVIWWQDEQFAISRCRQVPAAAQVWGVVTAVIHEFRKRARDKR